MWVSKASVAEISSAVIEVPSSFTNVSTELSSLAGTPVSSWRVTSSFAEGDSEYRVSGESVCSWIVLVRR